MGFGISRSVRRFFGLFTPRVIVSGMFMYSGVTVIISREILTTANML